MTESSLEKLDLTMNDILFGVKAGKSKFVRIIPESKFYEAAGEIVPLYDDLIAQGLVPYVDSEEQASPEDYVIDMRQINYIPCE